MVIVRAIYQNGTFQPIDDVNLADGQEVQLHIVSHAVSAKSIVEDLLVITAQSDADVFDEVSIMQELDEALTGKTPLSEIVIDERNDIQ